MTGVDAAEAFAVPAAIVVARMSNMRLGGPSLRLADHASLAGETAESSSSTLGEGFCDPDPTPGRAVLDLTLRDRCFLHRAIGEREPVLSTLTWDCAIVCASTVKQR